MPISFEVDPVKPSVPNLDNTCSEKPRTWKNPRCLTKELFESQLAKVGLKTVEGAGVNLTSPVQYQRPDGNSFLETCRKAYNEHVPLFLGPDEVWVAFSQATASFIRKEPEIARCALGVTHEGKKDLLVELPGFVKGDKANPWEQAFSNFGDALTKHVGKRRDLFDPSFSTTGKVEKASIQVQMLDTFSPFFKYYGRTCCGIPSIHLLGTAEDWRSINTRVVALGEILPPWIHDPMKLVAEKFESAALRNPDRKFWQNFVKIGGGSGGPYITGFINAFFPFESRGHKNSFLNPENFKRCAVASFEERVYKGSMGFDGPNPDDIHGSISSVPMTWLYYGEVIKMKFAAGMIGVTTSSADGVVGYRPTLGWMVGESLA